MNPLKTSVISCAPEAKQFLFHMFLYTLFWGVFIHFFKSHVMYVHYYNYFNLFVDIFNTTYCLVISMSYPHKKKHENTYKYMVEVK